MGWSKAERAAARVKRLERCVAGHKVRDPRPPHVIHGEQGRRKINSRRKGQVGELEFAEFLQKYDLNARRGQQFKGGQDSPDVVCNDLTNVHFEVKRTQRGNPYDWLAQAEKDARSNMPVVAHRRNNQKWIAIVSMETLVELLLIREGNYL